MLPILRAALTNNESAGKGGKGHRNARQGYPDAGTGGGRRVVILDAAQISVGGNQIAPATVAGALAR